MESGSSMDRQVVRLVDAARSGDASALAALLSEPGTDPNAVADGTTTLEAAALEGHAEVVQLLLRAKAHPDPRDSDGWTPLHNAMLVSSLAGLAIVRDLVEGRADVHARGW